MSGAQWLEVWEKFQQFEFVLGGFINLVLTTDTYKDLTTEFGRLELSLLHQKMALKQGHRLVPTTSEMAECFEIAMRAPK